jgi:putative hemolysin
MDQLGHIPDTAEAFVWDRSRFEVVDMDGMRIEKVIVEEMSPRADAAPAVSTY